MEKQGSRWKEKSMTNLERFEAKFIPEPNSGCWLWMASENGRGYGQFSVGGKPCKAYRFSYEQYRGTIPSDLTVDHLCRNRLCVNPDHLELVTNRTNVLRGAGHTARNAAKTQCSHGHPYDEVNTYRYRGKRYCKTCQGWAFLVERKVTE